MVTIDDFDMILVIDFFFKTQIIVILYMSGMMVLIATNPNFVLCMLVGKNLTI